MKQIFIILFIVLIYIVEINAIHRHKQRTQRKPKKNRQKTIVIEQPVIEFPTIETIPNEDGGNGMNNGGNNVVYVTYHPYKATDSLETVACSNGANGIMVKYGMTTLDQLFPYVTASSFATWNSPNCGGCYQLNYKGKSIKITVIDQCQMIDGYSTHFDLSREAFEEISGNEGIHTGHFIATYSKISSGHC